MPGCTKDDTTGSGNNGIGICGSAVGEGFAAFGIEDAVAVVLRGRTAPTGAEEEAGVGVEGF